MKIYFLPFLFLTFQLTGCAQKDDVMKGLAEECKNVLMQEIPDYRVIDTIFLAPTHYVSKGWFLYCIPQVLYEEALANPAISPQDSAVFAAVLDSLLENTSFRSDEPDILYRCGVTAIYHKKDGTLGRAFKEFFFDLQMKMVNRDSLYKAIGDNHIDRIGKYYRPHPVSVSEVYEPLYPEISRPEEKKDFLFVYD